MKAVFLSFLCCLSVSVLSAQSGVLKTIGGAAKNKVEQQDFNSTRGNKEKNQYQNNKRSAPAPGAAPESAAPEPQDTTTIVPGGVPSSTEDAMPMFYIFGQQLTYVLDDPSQNSKRSDTVTYYYRDGAIMSLLPGRQSSILMDFGNERLIQFDEVGKTAIVMQKELKTAPAQPDAHVTVTRTGQTKQILGFTCEEYIVQGNTKSVCWVTTELDVDYAETMNAISGYVPRGFQSQGQLLEMTGYNSKGVANTHMILTDFKKETVVKELNGYTVTKLD